MNWNTLTKKQTIEYINNILDTIKMIENIIELTKKNETKYSGCISDVISQIDLRGEFVIIFKNENENNNDINSLIFEIDKLVKKRN